MNWTLERDKSVYKRPFDVLLKGPKLIGAEIGVLRGFHAFEILQVADIKKLYLIDPWIDYSGNKGNEIFEYAKKVLKDYSAVLKWIRKTSKEAVKLIPDKSLDWAYLDGNHNPEYIWEDVNIWAPKVKIGGYVGGHDYDGAFIGVIQAVKKYCAKHNIKYQVRGKKEFKNYTSFSDWAFKKGGEIERWEDETNN